jgi:UDP-glucuronate 4-epimerase
MRYLVTGAAGFIGFHLSKNLCKDKKSIILGLDSYHSYYSLKLKKLRIEILKKNSNFSFSKIDLTNKKKLENTILKFKPDVIYHLAGQPGVIYSFKNPKSYLDNNILSTKNIISCIKKINFLKFIFASSSSVYGDQRNFPVGENFKLKPKNLYAKTKQVCERIIFNNLDKKKFLIFRFFTVYGPLGRPDMFLASTLKKISNNAPITIFNNGNHYRDFTYVADVVKILIKSIFYDIPLRHRIFNICASQPVKLLDLLSIINLRIKNKSKIIFKKKRKGEMIKTYGSNKLLKKNFKFKKFVNIKDGLNKTILSFKKYNY